MDSLIKKIQRLSYTSVLFLMLLYCSRSTNADMDNMKWKDGPLAQGCPETVYPDYKTSPYVLPYPVGKAYQVGLSNCSGSFHSSGTPDEYAIDFNMSVGTIITASRAGVIGAVEGRGYDGGFPNNFVLVRHGDGTSAIYMHLTHDGNLVDVGTSVAKGDKIGLSGSTGLAGYPHLHFVVIDGEDYNWPYKSVPVTFYNTLTNINSLASNTMYRAFKY